MLSLTDVWSLGCVVHEMCCLKRTFDAPNKHPAAITNLILTTTPSRLNHIYSVELQQLVDLMLQKESEQRPSVTDLLNMGMIKEQLARIYICESDMTETEENQIEPVYSKK